MISKNGDTAFEYIAIKANKEDHCSGRFWEGRFKSQALLDEKALLSCMAYVDLNPIRAVMATTPETSEYTCVQARLVAKQAKLDLPTTIEAFVGSNQDIGLPFNLEDYLELVDWSARILREDKRGSISDDLPPILERLKFTSEVWSVLTNEFESKFSYWVGSEHIAKKAYQDRHYQRIPKSKNYSALLG